MIPSDISEIVHVKYLNHLRPATILGDNSTPHVPRAPAGALSMAKILIVDDNPDVREVLRCQLEMLGYLVISAENGYTGIAKAIAEQPDLILMDIMMPEMDGWQASRAVRDNPETKDIPILAATAMCRRADLNACLEAGCNGYIVKPFTMIELKRKIGELITQNCDDNHS
jgi:two-component system cell cycle response regulator DivK